MILVTGATGNIGSALVQELAGAAPVRALTRDAGRARVPAGVEVVEGDLEDVGSLSSALDGVRSIFLLSRLGPDEEIIDAARRAGVEHVVLVSSITVTTHPHLGPAAENAAVEKLVEAGGMEWTILRPTQFASNTAMWAPAISANQPVEIPYADVGLPTIHPADIASVARVALTDSAHRGRRYELTGPELITARQQVEQIAAGLGREVAVLEISREQARSGMVEVFGEDAADAVLDLIGGDVNEELLAVRDTVERITGAPARPFHQWVAENIAVFR
ncbi:SDR family oxidoreductase [Nocardia cyriacigeorgica]|uniref:SDR family oxidoreductase n=1 Tax=Nocardia cyriacigeorgica TaxID=135487 RepID=UPI001894846F|nr:NAD(P)H-binding protein [Nocardia cyriacigeorgica]MBF6412853.1 NAD(P)H-binding protein [Nocardia cyriacigeorgica]